MSDDDDLPPTSGSRSRDTEPDDLIDVAMPLDDVPAKAAMRARLSATLFGITEELPTVGRFRVLRRLGRGGMGVVYQAHDDELDRDVAIKILHEDVATRHAARLRQEARTLAKLSHPNVISVFEVRTWKGRLFLAMELVRGCTLHDWEQRHRGDRPGLVALYVQAGRALAAAHAAGIVHRDFKPTNVMVGDDGRVRVLDFGLAVVMDTPGRVESSASERPHDPLACLTRTGATMGTPGYMSPEQLRGGEVGPASDQFSFCVSLYEALHGKRPFEGDTEPDYLDAVLNDRRRRPAPSGMLGRLIERGLATDPARRHPSMDVLIEGIERSQRKRPWGAYATLGTLVVGLGTWSALSHSPEACALDPTTPWSASKARASVEAIAKAPRTATTDERINREFDEWGRLWADAADSACTQLEAADSTTTRARALVSIACLDLAHRELDMLFEIMVANPSDGILHSTEMLATLRAPEDCLTAPPPMNRQATRDEVQTVLELRTQLARARFLRLSGRYDEASEVLDALSRDPRVDDEGLGSEVLLERGRIANRRGDELSAVNVLEDAAARAVRDGRDDVAADAWIEIAHVETLALRRLERARASVRQATAYVERLPENLARRASCDAARGRLLSLEGDHSTAAEVLLEALDRTAEALGQWHPMVAQVAIDAGNEESALGHDEAALELYQRAMTIRTRNFGSDHIRIAPILHNIARVHAAAGRGAEAEQYFRRALAMLETAGNDQAVLHGRTMLGLAVELQRSGRRAEALELANRSEQTFRDQLGPAHEDRVAALSLRANLHDQMELHEAALHDFQVLRAVHDSLGAEVEWAKVAINIPSKLVALERWDEARHELDATIPRLERLLGPEHAWLAIPYYLQARVERHAGNDLRMLEALERAWAVDPDPALAKLHVDIGWDLAQALPPGHRSRAVHLATEALEGLDPGDPRAAEISAWLRPQ